MPEKTLDLFETLPFQCDEALFVVIFHACASLSDGRALTVEKILLNKMLKKYVNDVIMLMKFGDVTGAENLYAKLPKPNIVSYGVLMNGYQINQQSYKCLRFWEEIKARNVVLNEALALSLLNACAQIGIRATSRKIVPHLPSYSHTKQ